MRNTQSKSAEQLEQYDVEDFDRPSVAVDNIIFTVKDNDLKVALIKRSEWPFEGKWALPGSFVEMEESLEDAAERVLDEKIGVDKDVYMEQLYTFGEADRDPRTRVISVGYFALVNQQQIDIERTEKVEDINWHSVQELPELGFDHEEIIEYAVKRLRSKVEYSTAIFSLLPKKFTLTQLQDTYEVILDRKLDKRNFRKKIDKKNLVEETGERQKNVSHRPAKLYRANKEVGEIIEIL